MSTVADSVDVVIGVDTHAHTHSYAVCTPTGAVIDKATLSTSPHGLSEALGLITKHAGDDRTVLVAMEGTRSYGIGLARILRHAGVWVIEAEHPERAHRRGRGKSDPIDAVRAARSALDHDITKVATPRSDGAREGLRILLVARRDLTDERTAKVNALRALLRNGNPHEHSWASAPITHTLLNTLTRRRGTNHDTIDDNLRRIETRRLATRIRDLDTELKHNTNTLHNLVQSLTPTLLNQPGIGPISAAQAIVAYSHHGRCRNDAAYAKLAGTAPLEASSGETTRHRLNRGGDRQLNKALHDIVKTRMRCCEHTRTYVKRRQAEGKTTREIRRCLKRYVARQLYRQLTNTPTLTLDNT